MTDATHTADSSADDAGSLITESGVSVNVLKRHVDGHWQIHITSLTSDTPDHA